MHARLWKIKFMSHSFIHVFIRSSNIWHSYILNRLKFMLLFLFRCSYIPRSCFSSNFLLLMFIFILHFVSLWYIFVYLLMWFFFVRLFFSYSSSFFFLILLHSFSFFKKLFPICSWCLTPFYNSFIYSFIYVLPQIHENLTINYRRAILLATFMPGLRQTKGNIFISSLLIFDSKIMKTIYYSPRASWTDDYIEALRLAITK